METKTTTSPKPNHVAAITRVNGETFGRVVMRGRTFTASRKHGQQGVDIRRYATGFRSLAAAVAWVEAAA